MTPRVRPSPAVADTLAPRGSTPVWLGRFLGLGLVCVACTGDDGKDPVASDDSGTDSVVDSTPDSGDTDSVDSGDSGCLGASPTLWAPVDGATYIVDDVVTISAGAAGAADALAVDVDGVTVGEGTGSVEASWGASLGDHTVTVTESGTCANDSVSVTIHVVADSTTTFGSELGLVSMSVKGLSVAPDGTLWAATTTHGLLHLDPGADTVRAYTTADGLYTDSPYAVLAHSDGTLWVGDVGDVDRQGSHFTVNDDGSLSLIQIIDFTESTEIAYVLRLREQPWGVGAGDVWMGTNEGLCVWDADLDVFSEHAHPTHPHSLTYGVAMTSDASIWNGDQYQLSRWEYSNDGNLSPSYQSEGGDLAEYWVPWPVDVEETIGITDLDADDMTLWVTSSLFGVARVDVGADVGTSTTTLLAEPFPATATSVRADGEGHVWIGTSSGLLVWDTTTETMTDETAFLPDPAVHQLAVDTGTTPTTVWAATSAGFVRFVGP